MKTTTANLSQSSQRAVQPGYNEGAGAQATLTGLKQPAS